MIFLSIIPQSSEGPATMNIVTFTTPVTIKPARRMVLSLYHDTLSLDNFMASKRGVLQAGLTQPTLPFPSAHSDAPHYQLRTVSNPTLTPSSYLLRFCAGGTRPWCRYSGNRRGAR